MVALVMWHLSEPGLMLQLAKNFGLHNNTCQEHLDFGMSAMSGALPKRDDACAVWSIKINSVWGPDGAIHALLQPRTH